MLKFLTVQMVCIIEYKAVFVLLFNSMILLMMHLKILKKMFDFLTCFFYTNYQVTSMLIMITSISPIQGVLPG